MLQVLNVKECFQLPRSAVQTAVWPAVSLWSRGADGTNCSESSASDLLYTSPAGDRTDPDIASRNQSLPQRRLLLSCLHDLTLYWLHLRPFSLCTNTSL